MSEENLSKSAPSEGASSAAPARSSLPFLNLYFTDPLGDPIEGLGYRLMFPRGAEEGTTDSEGAGTPLSMRPGTPFRLQVITDKGDPKTLFVGRMPGSDTTLSAQSPCIKVPIATEVHEGTPSSIAPVPTPPASAAPSQPSKTTQANPTKTQQPTGTNNTPKVAVESKRSAKGHPIVEIKPPKSSWKTFSQTLVEAAEMTLEQDPSDGLSYAVLSWMRARKAMPKAAVGTPELQRLWRMIHFARIQCEWDYKPMTVKKAQGKGKDGKSLPPKEVEVARSSIDIYRQLVVKRDDYVVSPDISISRPSIADEKVATKSRHLCYKYVKVALAMGEYSGEAGKLGAIPLRKIYGEDWAREAGSQLARDGWVDVTESLFGDPLLAAAGDVIVYEQVNRTVNINDATGRIDITMTRVNRPGHIEIRTYDGFISDYWKARPVGRSYRILGIWRKPGYSDLEPIYRLKAFLRVIEQREVGTVNLPNNLKPLALNTPIDGKNYFSDTDTHPWFGRKNKPSGKNTTAAGRYQIKINTWVDAIRNRGFGCIPTNFTAETQMRVALHAMLWCGIEAMDSVNCRTVLALVREGGDDQIKDAVKRLATGVWTSLPKDEATPHPNGHYTLGNFITDFNRYLAEERSRQG